MENPSPQPQYFKFNSAPPEAPKPWFQRPEVLKRMALGGGAFVVLVFGAILVNNVVKNVTSAPKTALQAAQAEVAQRQADCDPTDAACKTQAQTQVARASGVAAACDGLESAAQANCVTLIALEKKDASACADLSGEDASACTDAVILARVSAGEGMALCEGVSSTSKKSSCEALVTATARSTGECAKYGVDASVCDAQRVVSDLLAATNFAGCAELETEERVNCEELFSVTDADGDGLTAQEESELGTSDTNADTDGDGYTDGVEVKAGYNPLN